VVGWSEHDPTLWVRRRPRARGRLRKNRRFARTWYPKSNARELTGGTTPIAHVLTCFSTPPVGVRPRRGRRSLHFSGPRPAPGSRVGRRTRSAAGTDPRERPPSPRLRHPRRIERRRPRTRDAALRRRRRATHGAGPEGARTLRPDGHARARPPRRQRGPFGDRRDRRQAQRTSGEGRAGNPRLLLLGAREGERVQPRQRRAADRHATREAASAADHAHARRPRCVSVGQVRAHERRGARRGLLVQLGLEAHDERKRRKSCRRSPTSCARATSPII